MQKVQTMIFGIWIWAARLVIVCGSFVQWDAARGQGDGQDSSAEGGVSSQKTVFLDCSIACLPATSNFPPAHQHLYPNLKDLDGHPDPTA